MARAEARQPDLSEGGGRRLLIYALAQEVVAGVLQQQRDPPAGGDGSARRFQETGGVAQERGLARAVAPHQHHALARSQPQIDAAQNRRAVAKLVPYPCLLYTSDAADE